MTSKSFSNKTVLVTGGASGIGRASAIAFAKAGANVFILDIDIDGMNAVAREITSDGGKAVAHKADVTKEHEVIEAITRCVELSRPLLSYIKEWLALEGDAKAAAILFLHTRLVDGQDCDFTGTQWEKEWLADGKVCHCVACVAARKCISDIKLVRV